MCTSYSQQLALRSFQPLSLGLSVHLPWCLLKQIKLSCWQPIVLAQYRGGELQSWLLPLYSTEIQWLNDRSELKEEDLNEKNWNRRYRWSRIIAWHSTDYHRMPVTEVACYIPPAHRAGTHHWYTPLEVHIRKFFDFDCISLLFIIAVHRSYYDCLFVFRFIGSLLESLIESLY